jgi:RNA polymerase sigma-70 factor (ECF subfamily)
MGNATDPTDLAELPLCRGDPLERLLREARHGSEEAFGQLVEACRRYLTLVARWELSVDLQAKFSASDIVQDTFIKAKQGFAGFDGHSRRELLGWLRAILLRSLAQANRRYEQVAKRDVAREVSLDAVGAYVQAADLPVRDPSPSERAMGVEAQDELVRAIDALPEDYRNVIVLHHRDGLDFPELAKRLGSTADAVRKRWQRAIKQLGNRLDPDHG